MEAYYPRFIRVMPKFFGLDLVDLAIFVIGLFSNRFFDSIPFLGLFLALIGIVLNKTVLKDFDFKGFILGRFKRSTIAWDLETRGRA